MENIPETGTIVDLNVCLNIEHTWPGDLVVTLRHDETGTTVDLINRVGVIGSDTTGCNLHDVTVYLDDGAAETIQDYCPPLPLIGYFIPAELLEAFNGQSNGGAWTLTVSDESQFDYGWLTGFSMTFVTATPTPTPTPTP